MTIYGSILPGARSIACSSSLADKLTEQAKYRLKILDWHKARGGNHSLTARHFGIGRATLHRWLKRFAQAGVIGLNEHSKKPKHFRLPTTPWQIVGRVVELRRQYPAWSKHKLSAILKRERQIVSASTVGRILKRKNLINEKVSAKKRRSALRPKARFPKGLRINHEGQMIQIDTKDIMLTDGHRFYQFTAIDILGKRRVLRVYSSQSSRNGASFLKECVNSFPFPVEAVQTDNGAVFLGEFDELCRKLKLPHYFTYPRHPKQNSYVEISHGADEREFYLQGHVCSILSEMQSDIKKWEGIWNGFRPHEALGQMTPEEYSNKLKLRGLPTNNIIVLQT